MGDQTTAQAGLSPRAQRLVPIGLRLFSLALRSVLVFLLARYLPPAQIGIYGLLVVTIAYVIFPLGFDFYTYSTREILRSDRARWPTFLRSQVAFTLVLYAIICPALLLLFVAGLLPWTVVLWFYILIPLEHLGLELDRLLIAMLDQVGASIGLFLRQALTPLVVVPILALVPQSRSLEVVLAAWALFDLIGVLVGLGFVRRRLAGTSKGTVDWSWVRQGIMVSVPFLIGTLCLRALFTVDRQVLQVTANLEVVAAYTLFMTIGNGLTNIIYAGVHQFAYPQLVKAAHDRNLPSFRKNLKSMLVRTLIVIAGVSLAAIALLPLLLAFVGHDTYREYAWMLPWVLVVTGLYNLSLVPHFALYALDEDRTILWLTVASLAFFAITVAIFAVRYPVPAVLAGIFAASCVLLAGKAITAWARLRRVVPDWAADSD